MNLHPSPPRRLPPSPDLDWSPDGAPRARGVDDIYFSSAGGLDETRAVFLAGCGLPDRWRGRKHFAIAELGFGAGLNALATWAAWRATRDPGATLHYVSVESTPMDRADAARALAAFPQLKPLAEALLARWPVRAWGPQRLWFEADGLALTVMIADAADALADLDGAIDAWFLDGFAPAKNPAMWSDALIARVAALSAPDARVATYSVAGAVRRGLAAAGFVAEKKPGFAGKRERLEARLAAPRASRAPSPASAIVIGAGIGGACIAHALDRRGVAVTVLESAPAPAGGASGNPAALLSPRLDRGDTGASRLHRAAYFAALDHYRTLGALTRTGLERRGMEAGVLADLRDDPPLPPTHLQAGDDGLFFPDAGLVDPRAAIDAMLTGADLRCSVRVATLIQTPRGWAVRNAEGAVIAEAALVILAAGTGLASFRQTRWAPLEFSRGQLEWAPSPAPTHALENGTYAAPFAGGVVFGATFDRMASPDAVAPDDASRAWNLTALARLAPDIAARIAHATLQSRAAIRVATADRAPLVGPAPDADAFARDPAARHAGLWMFGAFGSRGFTLAPILAEYLASQMCGDPDGLGAAVRAVVNPVRYLARARKRGQPIPA